MMVIPFQVNQTEYFLFIALADDNIARTKMYDPAEIPIKHLGAAFQKLKLRSIMVGYYAPGEEMKIAEHVRNGDVGAAIGLLMRGWRFRPESGDHDGPPLSLKKQEGETTQ